MISALEGNTEADFVVFVRTFDVLYKKWRWNLKLYADTCTGIVGTRAIGGFTGRGAGLCAGQC